jgi:hypothetical protein
LGESSCLQASICGIAPVEVNKKNAQEMQQCENRPFVRRKNRQNSHEVGLIAVWSIVYYLDSFATDSLFPILVRTHTCEPSREEYNRRILAHAKHAPGLASAVKLQRCKLGAIQPGI